MRQVILTKVEADMLRLAVQRQQVWLSKHYGTDPGKIRELAQLTTLIEQSRVVTLIVAPRPGNATENEL